MSSGNRTSYPYVYSMMISGCATMLSIKTHKVTLNCPLDSSFYDGEDRKGFIIDFFLYIVHIGCNWKGWVLLNFASWSLHRVTRIPLPLYTLYIICEIKKSNFRQIQFQPTTVPQTKFLNEMAVQFQVMF